MKRICGTFACLGLAARVAGQAPIQMPIADKTYGPDGPWQAVEIAAGTNNQTIHLLPGGWYETDLLAPSVCGASTAGCPAAAAGLFDVTKSSPAVAPSDITKPGFIDQWNAGPEMNTSGTGVLMLDQLSFTATSNQQFVIPQAALSLVQTSTNKIANGSTYPAEIGFLALGSPVEATSYTLANRSNVVGNLLPGLLANKSVIPSNSFGLHIGSAVHNQKTSLVFGGYDQSRVLGEAAEYALSGVAGGEPIVTMVDLTLGVETGDTPFNTSTVGSLYRPSSTLNTSEPMSLNPTVPYMLMPIGLCEAVAEYIPVTWDASLGLYLWNTEDPQYARIVNSPAWMGVTLSQAGKDNVQIRVPFAVLNLTLTSPLVATPTPYFPCKPSYTKTERFFLGRAFLQAAYLSIDWTTATFFVAQAGGPASDPSTLIPLHSGDTLQSTSQMTFGQTWAGTWTVLDNSPTGLSPGAKAGIAIGVILAVALIAALAFFIVRRRQQQRARAQAEMFRATDMSKHDPKNAAVGFASPTTPLPRYPGPQNGWELENRINEKKLPMLPAELEHAPLVEMQDTDVPAAEMRANPRTSLLTEPVEIGGFEIGRRPSY